jgi:hypothetical protein
MALKDWFVKAEKDIEEVVVGVEELLAKLPPGVEPLLVKALELLIAGDTVGAGAAFKTAMAVAVQVKTTLAVKAYVPEAQPVPEPPKSAA